MYVFSLVYILLLAGIPISTVVYMGSLSIYTPSEWLAILFCVVHLPHIRHIVRTTPLSPITSAVLFALCIMAFTTLTSSMFEVSLKWFLRSTLYTTAYYILPLYLFRQQGIHILGKALTAYTLALICVCIYTWAHHASYSFTPDTAILAPQPFFPEHTVLGATLTILLLLGNTFLRLPARFYIPLAMILGVTLYNTYSRAAWLTLFLGALVLLMLRYRRRVLPYVLLIGSLIVLIGTQFPKNVVTQKIRSVTNFTTDVSNLERLNRYACAWDMFCQRPLTGYGPGTYQFQYLPFQNPNRTTRISVYSANIQHPTGRGGSAHSEYLLALSESGIGGILYIFAIILATLYLPYMHFRQTYTLAPATIATLAALSSYAIHGMFNNFFEHDKIAALILTLLAYLTHTYQRPTTT